MSQLICSRYKKKLALQKSLSEVVRAFPSKKESVQIKIIHSKSFFFIKIDFMSAYVPTFELSTSEVLSLSLPTLVLYCLQTLNFKVSDVGI